MINMSDKPKIFLWRGKWRDETTGRQLGKREVELLTGAQRSTYQRYEALGEYIIKHLPSREATAVNSMALYQRVIEDYGSVNMRVFFQRLVDMRAAGEVNFKGGERVREIVYWRKR